MYIMKYFSDNKYKYSTELMFAYINLCNHNKTRLNIDDLAFNLEYNCWENGLRPIDVMNDIKNKKYKEKVFKIKHVDMKYPIILDSNYNIL